MNDPSNRTFVCSVLFLDIVEYSKKSVTEQLRLKQRFNALLVAALQHVAVSDRIVLDTGDGAAISFLGNPEDSLFVGIDLRDAIAAESPNESPPLLVRIGVNLGRGKSKSYVVRNPGSSAVAQLRFECGADLL